MNVRCVVVIASLSLAWSVQAQTDKDFQEKQAGAADAIAKIPLSKSRMILYSISPTRAEPTDFGSKFYGYPILGSGEITSASEEAQLVAALAQGVKEANYGARCFNPRHGLRVFDESVTNDFLICFECGYVMAHGYGSQSFFANTDPQRFTEYSVSPSPQPTFDAIVSRHHLKIQKFLFWGTVLLSLASVWAVASVWLRKRKPVQSVAPAAS